MTVFTNATIHTQDPSCPRACVLVTEGKEIAYVGMEIPERFEDREVVDLQSRSILPPAVDTHIHFGSYATFAAGLFVYDATDLASLFDMIRTYADQGTGPILGFGVSPHALEEGRLPTLHELDDVLPDRPLFLVKYDGHSAVTNSALHKTFPPGLSQARGYSEGLLELEAFYEAAMHISGSVSQLQLLRDINSGAHSLVASGFGMIHATEGVGFKKDLDVTGLYHLARGLPIETRLFFQTMELQKVKKLGLPRVGGCFSCALDGCFGTHDAALHEPYADDPNDRGVLFYKQEEVDRYVLEAHKAGLQVSLHAIGDRAVTQAIDAFEKAQTAEPREDTRHTIIHASLVREEDKDRMADLGICVATQPAMLTLRQEPLDYIEKLLGDRAARIVPIGSLIRRGIRVGFGSDAPVTLPSIATSLHAALNHPNADERIDLDTAIAAHTRVGGEMTFDEKDFGVLKKGADASFVIMEDDLDDLELDRLADTGIYKVYQHGHPLSGKAGGILSLIGGTIKGYLNGRKV